MKFSSPIFDFDKRTDNRTKLHFEHLSVQVASGWEMKPGGPCNKTSRNENKEEESHEKSCESTTTMDLSPTMAPWISWTDALNIISSESENSSTLEHSV